MNIPTPPALCLGTPVLRQKWYVSFAMRMHEYYGSRELYHAYYTYVFIALRRCSENDYTNPPPPAPYHLLTLNQSPKNISRSAIANLLTHAIAFKLMIL